MAAFRDADYNNRQQFRKEDGRRSSSSSRSSPFASNNYEYSDCSSSSSFQQRRNGEENNNHNFLQRYVGPCLISNRLSNSKGASRVYFGITGRNNNSPTNNNCNNNNNSIIRSSSRNNNHLNSSSSTVVAIRNTRTRDISSDLYSSVTGAPLINFRFSRTIRRYNNNNCQKSARIVANPNVNNDKNVDDPCCSIDLASLGVGLIAVESSKRKVNLSNSQNSTTAERPSSSETDGSGGVLADSGLETSTEALNRRLVNNVDDDNKNNKILTIESSDKRRRKRRNYCKIMTDYTSTTLKKCKCEECKFNNKPPQLSYCYLSLKKDGYSNNNNVNNNYNYWSTPPLITIAVPPNCCIIKDDDSLKLSASFTSEDDESLSSGDSLESLDNDDDFSPPITTSSGRLLKKN